MSSTERRAERTPPLVAVTVVEAQRQKWQEGRCVYGGYSFQGDPVDELYAELIDGQNFCEEAERQGVHLAGVPDMLFAAAVAVRAILRERRS